MDSGPLAGFPVIDFKVALVDGKPSTTSTRSVLAFEIASRACMREAAFKQRGRAKLLEPIMKVEVVTPEEYTGGIIGDLTSPPWPGAGPGHPRQRESSSMPSCRWPTCSSYIDTLRSMSSGPRASSPCSSITTSRCRQNISEEIQAKYA